MRQQQQSARRATISRAGAVALGLCFCAIVVPLSACVFDSGSGYQGGGRNSPVKKEENSTDPTATATTTATTTTPAPDSAVPPVDAGGGG